MPHIGRDLDIPDTRQQWIVSSYVLAFGCFLLLWGRIADIYGKRLIFIFGSIWVTVCCVVNPFLPSEIPFDLFRALHGLVSFSILHKDSTRVLADFVSSGSCCECSYCHWNIGYYVSSWKG